MLIFANSEEVAWQQAMNSLEQKRYSEAQIDLRQILNMPAGGVRKDDARRCLDQVIPQRIVQNTLTTQVQQNLKKENFQLARQQADQLRRSGADPSSLIRCARAARPFLSPGDDQYRYRQRKKRESMDNERQ
jgi:hypothetical protein